jgi:hypothetical protein
MSCIQFLLLIIHPSSLANQSGDAPRLLGGEGSLDDAEYRVVFYCLDMATYVVTRS